VRYAPALAKKPTKSDGEKQDKPQDPFAPPYQPDLFVAEDTVKEDEDDQGEVFAVLVSRAVSLAVPLLPKSRSFRCVSLVEQILRNTSSLLARYEGVREANNTFIPRRGVRSLLDSEAARNEREASRFLQLRS
jgi:hypothetical protein